jgi:isopenicillin-N epimerase
VIHDESFWQAKRRLTARDPNSINLNAGTLSPTPIPVLERVTQLRRQMAQSPSNFLWRESGPLLDRSRARLAQYLNCDTHDLLLIPNATYGVNLAAASMDLRAGDEVLTTDHEYGAMMHCWRHHALRAGFALRELTLPYLAESPDQIVEAFARELRPNTKAIYFSQVTTSTGLVLPAERICARARERNIMSIIDGAHAPGMVPVDLARIGADFYTANCHKWLMAPAGAGFLHVALPHKAKLRPVIISWGHGYDPSRADETCTDGAGGTYWQRDLEFHGTTDRCPQMVVADAIEFRAELGGDDAIAARVRAISDYARNRIAACGFASATPANPDLRGSLTAFALTPELAKAIRANLWKTHRIECPVTSAAGKEFLRVSTGWFTSHEEIDALASALAGIPDMDRDD